MSSSQRSSKSTLSDLIARTADGNDLSAADAEHAFTTLMEGRASAVQTAGLLVGLRAKGEVPEEIAGGVRAMRGAMVSVGASEDADLVDTCGTGGGRVTTFNISTAAALVAAGAGVRIAKHGNRSFSSKCGSADVLEALGVTIELEPEAMAEVLDRTGIVFMFAPLLHPAMRHVAPVRRELRMPTIMNLLGPLTNPAGAKRQVVGVSDPALLELIAGGLRELGHERALVVHGEPGMDEISPLGATDVIELRDGALERYRFDPEAELGWAAFDEADLEGGDPEENARILESILSGRREDGARAAVTLNAGAALFVADVTDSLADGVAEAERVLDSGAGMETLDRLRTVSGELAE